MQFWHALNRLTHHVGTASADLFDRITNLTGHGPEQRRAAFTTAVVALAAKMAKADGVVTMAEAASFWRHFDVPEHSQRAVRRLFNFAQRDVAGFEAYAYKIARLFPNDPETRETILNILFTIAAADGVVHPAEMAFLERVAAIFGIDGVRLSALRARHLKSENDPYQVLGVDPTASDEAIKRRYRELVMQYHPDRLLARGVPDAFVRVASDNLSAINEAFETIEKQRREPPSVAEL